MLMEKRFQEILRILEEQGTVSVQDLTESLDASEATIRRDLSQLAQMGRLKKIYGGAASLETGYQTREIRVEERQELYVEEKKQIAKYAASLIEPGDFVYVDAGSSTEYLVEYIEERDATYVTNSMSHALKLAGKGMKVSILGGNVKGTTEAVVGADAMETLRRYHFTRGFWGADGIRKKEGCTTPEMEEAAVKRLSMKQTRDCYVLCDGSKFGKIAQVTFAELADVTVITAGLKDKKYKKYENIVEVEGI